MTHIIGIAGSLRKASINAALLRAAQELAPSNSTIEIASIAEVPLYNGDIEALGMPSPVIALREQIAAADGLLIVTPEYNHSIPGVLKNAFDWLSRPLTGSPPLFADKPIAIIGATPGMGGTRLAQTAWLPVLRSVGARPWFGKQLYVSGAGKAFDADGALVDETIAKLLSEYVAAFAASIVNS